MVQTLEQAKENFCKHLDSCNICRLVIDRWVCCMVGKALLKEWQKYERGLGN